MSKIICEICGTVYPDNATACPICGYPRSVTENLDSLQSEAAPGAERGGERVRGGRFSNKNVKKRNETVEEAPKPRRGAPQEPAKPAKKASGKTAGKEENRGLIITVYLLLAAVVIMGLYIGLRFFRGADAYRETTLPPETDASVVTEAVPADTGVACTDILLPDVDLAQGIEFLGIGRAWRLNVSLVPEGTTEEVTYTSSDEKVAVVNVSEDRVEILSVGPGSATISITCGGVTKLLPVECNFELGTEVSDPTEDTREEGVLALDKEDITFAAVDESYTLDPGMGIEAEDVTWTSADKDVATVDETGKVVAVGPGTTEITAEYDGEEATCIVRCDFEEATEEVRDDGGPYILSHTDVSIAIGETFTLTLKDKNYNIVDVTWVGDEDVEIDGNDITGVGYGTVYVTCTHNGEEFECIVRVG